MPTAVADHETTWAASTVARCGVSDVPAFLTEFEAREQAASAAAADELRDAHYAAMFAVGWLKAGLFKSGEELSAATILRRFGAGDGVGLPALVKALVGPDSSTTNIGFGKRLARLRDRVAQGCVVTARPSDSALLWSARILPQPAAEALDAPPSDPRLDWRLESDRAFRFLRSYYRPDPSSAVGQEETHRRYRAWCGLKAFPAMGGRHFARVLLGTFPAARCVRPRHVPGESTLLFAGITPAELPQ